MEERKFVATEYRGNHIFRQQPNHSYFDKPFNDQEDCLFQTLHEIDPFFLKAEQKADTINFINTILTDPRTKKPINKICYDYTKEYETAIFISPKKSFMKAQEHELGVRVLNLIQQRLEIEEEDMYNWYRLQKVRLREKQLFQKFVFEYCENNKESLYAPCRRFLKLYQKWYERKSVRLMKRYPHETYNTYLGLPQVRQCKNVLSDQQVHITNPEIVFKVGEQNLWQANFKKDFAELNHNIESYVKVFENSEDLQEALDDDLKQEFENITQQAASENPCLYIPLESLLFLVTAGEYADLPSEVLLNIKEVDDLGESRKYVIMDLPLPSRQGGWHTYEKVVEQAVIAMASIKQMKYLENDITEKAASIEHVNCFKVYTLEDFMENCKLNADKLCKFSKSLTKWQLSSTDDEINFEIYTSIDLFEENKSVALKLEYKPRFGCETLTKYETLKEWFKLKLTGATESSCLRLDVTNFHTLLEEALNVEKLEETLSSTMYQVKCNELLNNLFEFLKMLYGMPLGHYMLRYNPKFKDKLLLCKPSQEMTQNTVHLHQLITADVTDVEFTSQQNFLPIDDNLTNLMHLQHKILPAAFSPFLEVKKPKNIAFYSKQCNNLTQARKNPKSMNKRKLPQNNTESKKPVNRSKRKRANRRRRQFEALKAKRDELNEMKHEIELDRLMLENV